MKMRRILVLLMAFALLFNLAACGSEKDAGSAKKDIKIGVSIWSSTDTLGKPSKDMIDAAAEALGVEVMYVDQAHISEQVTASVETLVAAGCDGIIVCNSSAAEMTSIINTCNEHKVYVAQFYRYLNEEDNPEEYALAVSSPYYVGAVHEDEVQNGYTLAQILCEKGSRKIALQGWEPGDSTFLARWEGYKKGVEAWNEANPDDQAVLLEPQYGGTTSDTGRATAEAILTANPDADALIVAGGGGDPLVGAIEAIEGLGLTGKVNVASTDFLPDLEEQLKKGAIAVESGGHFCDPLYAFMLVYNAVLGNYEVPTDGFYEILFPYIYISSPEEYAEYEKYFVDQLPYNEEELIEMSKYSFEELKKSAESLSIEEVKSRRGE